MISGVAICTTGEAHGHGVWVDEIFVRAVVAAGNATPSGVKARWGHPSGIQDPVGTEMGRFRQFRAVYQHTESLQRGYPVWAAVANLHLLSTPANAAACGHLARVAAQDPALLGASLEFRPGPPAPPDTRLGNRRALPHERLGTLLAVALTSDPACNPNGLF